MLSGPASLLELTGQERGTIPGAFAERVRRTPSSPFLFWQGREFTYLEALDEIQAVAGYLASVPPAGRPRIATYLPNCPAAMWVWLGAMFAGRVLVPLNRKHRGALLADMLRRSQAGVLVTERSALDEIDVAALSEFSIVILVDGPGRPKTDAVAKLIGFDEARGAATKSMPATTPSDVACIMFTSGTTGRSKAVQVTHNQYVRGAARLVDAYQLRSSDVFHNWLPLYHVAGQLHMTMTAVVCGGAVALQPTFSTSRFWDEVNATRCSVLCGVAPILNFIWSLPAAPDDARSSLRVGIFGGVPPELHLPFEQRFGMSLGENYGMTEIDPITCPEPGVVPPPGSCGRASPDVEIAILDAEDRVLPPLALGQIAVRPRVPDVLMGGYEGDPETTLEAFHNLWFHTGDYGVLDADGFLYFKGRASHYIRRRGENVSTAELEAIMLGHPAVAECAAVGVPSEVGEDEIKAVLVLHPGASVTPQQVFEFATRALAAFMVPRFIEIRPKLPRGDLGKVNLAELRAATELTWDAQSFTGARSRR